MSIVPSMLDNQNCDLVVRASFLHFIDDPALNDNSYEYLEDGLLILYQGKVQRLVEALDWIDHLPDGCSYYDYSGRLILPGFIDTHNHYAQSEMIVSFGKQLLDWLQDYTFPTEAKFGDAQYAEGIADFYCDELLRNGTTTAAIYATVHPESVDAIFKQAQKRDMCVIAGKVMMDRNAPDYLCDSAELSYRQSAELIARWHQKGRAHYAVTPRFAPCSSEAQLEVCGQLLRENPELYLQSHAAENKAEVEWVAQLFPERRSYLDVYDFYQLLGERSIYGHCIYLDDQDRRRLAQSGAAIAYCPSSNLFLGSGLFDLDAAVEQNIRLGLATDVGAGTSFSLLKTMSDAYKVGQLAGQQLSPLKAFYLATLGGARSLSLEQNLGNFEPGKDADFVVVELTPTPIMEKRMEQSESIEDQLFALMMLGDDRNIQATHIMGKRQYLRAD
ncbi:MAG: guanine deaminase [Planctomycetota bacterium]|jgi:guanine deaminase